MSQIKAVFSNCDDTLVDSEVTRSHTYVAVFREFGIHADLREIFTRFKDVKLYETIDIISREQGVTMVQVDTEHIYRVEIARLFDTGLEDIAGANELLASTSAPMCVVSNSPVNKMQHSFGKLNTLRCSPKKLFSGYDIQRQKPGPISIFHAAKVMSVNVGNCILVDSSSAGAQLETGTGMEAFYSCADPHSKPIVHPKVTALAHLSQLPELWRAHGWDITAQLFTLPSLAPPKLTRRGE